METNLQNKNEIKEKKLREKQKRPNEVASYETDPRLPCTCPRDTVSNVIN